MKKRNLIYVLFISCGVALSSCSGDNAATPEKNKSSNDKAATTEPVSTGNKQENRHLPEPVLFIDFRSVAINHLSTASRVLLYKSDLHHMPLHFGLFSSTPAISSLQPLHQIGKNRSGKP